MKSRVVKYLAATPSRIGGSLSSWIAGSVGYFSTSLVLLMGALIGWVMTLKSLHLFVAGGSEKFALTELEESGAMASTLSPSNVL